MQATHGQLFSGHSGISKTAERIKQSYYRPNIEADISKCQEKCPTYQERRFQHQERSEILPPLPLCTQPYQRVHIELFKPLKTTKGRRMVLCMKGAFTKYIEVVAIENKSCKSFVQPNEFVNTALQKFSLR
jgi:hypothetical protein